MEQRDDLILIRIYNPLIKDIIVKPLEEFIIELVACSMPLIFHIEALKAQSIIMRTNVIRQMKVNQGIKPVKNSEADVSIEKFDGYTSLEQYKKTWGSQYEKNKKKIEKAAEETKGKIILFQNKPIDARFHAACGGATENSENIDGNIVRYLRKVLCHYCKLSPFSLNYKDLPLEDIEKKLRVQFNKGNASDNITIENMFYSIERDEEGRVKKLNVANNEFKGNEIMDILGLNSTRFSWKPLAIRFFTSGKGDGVGFCQYGANYLANEGKKAEEILQYYYTGIDIKQIEEKCINIPLKGKVIVIDPAHGGENGEDYRGMQGLREKDVNLDICVYLEQKLKEQGAETYMTRRSDEAVPACDRVRIANSVLPHFFISIHQNHFQQPSISGTEIYCYRGDKEAMVLGKEIIKELTKRLKTIDRGVKVADFFLLRDVKVSSLHIEVAYISNPDEEKRLMEESFKKEAAYAIADAIVNYYNY